jgi:hypothetical protein
MHSAPLRKALGFVIPSGSDRGEHTGGAGDAGTGAGRPGPSPSSHADALQSPGRSAPHSLLLSPSSATQLPPCCPRAGHVTPEPYRRKSPGARIEHVTCHRLRKPPGFLGLLRYGNPTLVPTSTSSLQGASQAGVINRLDGIPIYPISRDSGLFGNITSLQMLVSCFLFSSSVTG